jgi:hypothetical protein
MSNAPFFKPVAKEFVYRTKCPHCGAELKARIEPLKEKILKRVTPSGIALELLRKDAAFLEMRKTAKRKGGSKTHD